MQDRTKGVGNRDYGMAVAWRRACLQAVLDAARAFVEAKRTAAGKKMRQNALQLLDAAQWQVTVTLRPNGTRWNCTWFNPVASEMVLIGDDARPNSGLLRPNTAGGLVALLGVGE